MKREYVLLISNVPERNDRGGEQQMPFTEYPSMPCRLLLNLFMILMSFIVQRENT